MRDLWVPGVNELGGFGRWGFEEFCDWAVMDEDFAALVERLRSQVATSKNGAMLMAKAPKAGRRAEA